MRLAAPAVVGLLGASTALACDEEEGGSLERAAQIEKEAQVLLEQGRKAEGAKLMAKAWMLRAQSWSDDPGAKVGPAIEKGEVWLKLAEAKRRAADRER